MPRKQVILSQISIRRDAAEHGIAVDRFAREIVRFLNSPCAARSRQLNAKPFGTRGSVIVIPYFGLHAMDGDSGTPVITTPS
jgi:hypothetical protein